MRALLHSVPPNLQQATTSPCLYWRLLDTDGQVWVSLLWDLCFFLLDPVGHKVLFVPSESLFPQFFVISGSSMVELIATSSKKAYAISRSSAPRAPAPVAVHCSPVLLQETLRPRSGLVSVASLRPVHIRYIFRLSQYCENCLCLARLLFSGPFLEEINFFMRLFIFLILYYFWVAVLGAHSGFTEGKMKTPRTHIIVTLWIPMSLSRLTSSLFHCLLCWFYNMVRTFIWQKEYLADAVTTNIFSSSCQKWKPIFPFTDTATCCIKRWIFLY